MRSRTRSSVESGQSDKQQLQNTINATEKTNNHMARKLQFAKNDSQKKIQAFRNKQRPQSAMEKRNDISTDVLKKRAKTFQVYETKIYFDYFFYTFLF